MWMDRLPVHMLSTGGSRRPSTVMRRFHGEMKAVPAPVLMRDYHRWMGGVDVHDQLGMQRYSAQLANKTRKYYKTLFSDLFDMVLIRAHCAPLLPEGEQQETTPALRIFGDLLAVDSPEAFDASELQAQKNEQRRPQREMD
ncbi:Hypothetical protein PHPALM_14857 [Phytophthora palmivora]|uniref:PiggyBac transposable element-derived protein domain-containing protein n=1 Tax=Phytophthora palmivora TaxID=4796 RepID=A0A2P4XTM0_9STRA|nr:Hypothetical protein PHPALM_14857 [Phytophthora palmivora]